MVARTRAGAAGFTYVGLIVLVAILGLVGAATVKVDSLLRRAAAERELLEIGAAYSEALRSYAAATPRGQPSVPPTLQDLLKDPRFPGVRRHLRRIFVDPVTGRDEWGVLYQGDKTGVLAVYSLSQARPLKVANFDARFAHFENKEHLSDWKFTATGQGVGSTAPGPVPNQPLPQPEPPSQPPRPADIPAPPPEAPAEPESETDAAEPPAAEPVPEAEPEPVPGPGQTESGT